MSDAIPVQMDCQNGINVMIKMIHSAKPMLCYVYPVCIKTFIKHTCFAPKQSNTLSLVHFKLISRVIFLNYCHLSLSKAAKAF